MRGIFEFTVWPIFVLGFFVFLKNRMAGILVLAFLVGVFRVSYYMDEADRFWPVQDFVTLSGVVSAEVDKREDSQKIVLKTEYGQVLVSVSIYKDVHFGDTVRVAGVLEVPSNDIEGFNYFAYLAMRNVWRTMRANSFEVVSKAGFSVRGNLYAVKEKVESRLNELYFEPEASFAAGLLVGSRKGMPEELSEAFRVVGLMHIVAISGSNISLVIYMVSFLLVFLPFKRRMIVSSIFVFIFVCFVGASAAVVRAGFMGIIGLFGLYIGKRSQAIFALLWGAVFMVMLNPLVLLYDTGFQLSFSATLGLLCFVPILDKMIPKFEQKSEKFSFIREALLMTLSAQIAVFPISTFAFGTFSFIAPIANVFVAPFISFAMLFPALSVVFGKSIAIVGTFYLKIIECFALFFAKVPFASSDLVIGRAGFALMEIGLIFFVLLFYKSKLVRAFFRVSEVNSSKVLSLLSGKREIQ